MFEHDRQSYQNDDTIHSKHQPNRRLYCGFNRPVDYETFADPNFARLDGTISSLCAQQIVCRIIANVGPALAGSQLHSDWTMISANFAIDIPINLAALLRRFHIQRSMHRKLGCAIATAELIQCWSRDVLLPIKLHRETRCEYLTVAFWAASALFKFALDCYKMHSHTPRYTLNDGPIRLRTQR